LSLGTLLADYDIEAIVETGVGHGGSMKHALSLGRPLVYFGCDCDPEAIRICKEMVPNAILSQTDSVSFLRNLLAEPQPFAMPALWFLDAHFGAHEDAWPLLAELDLIAACKPNVDRDVIVVDDIRCIADEANPRYWPGELGAPYVRSEHAWAEYTAPFIKTHTVHVRLEDEGYLLLLPRITGAERGPQ
jgi:hypothetical protein